MSKIKFSKNLTLKTKLLGVEILNLEKVDIVGFELVENKKRI